MLFNSFTFFVFFPAVLFLHSLPLPAIARKINLLLAGYVFYAAWDVRFTLLLVFVTATNALAGKIIAKWDQFPRRRAIVLWLDLLLNLGLLSAFKYGNELIAGWGWIAQHVSLPDATIKASILLPVGLSFFTLQALSYTIDVYRRAIGPARSILDVALFVSFFPVLLAGPLLRAGPFMSQTEQPRRATGAELGFGAALVSLGLFLKVVLADYLLAPVVQQVFDAKHSPDALAAWVGTIGFAAQDYCDFAGYSSCAVGLGHCLGFCLPDNFRAPFSSIGFRDLWQRWHITLVAWMRDYVFNPLGGVYKGYRRAAINVLIVFLLIGLWHGATWPYLIFGILHGCYLVGEVALQRLPIRRLPFWNTYLGMLLLWLLTMLLCMIAFVFYRAPELPQSWRMLSTMFGLRHSSAAFQLTDYDIFVVSIVCESLVVAHWLCRKVRLDELVARVPWWTVAICLALMLFAITITSGESESYLYFHY